MENKKKEELTPEEYRKKVQDQIEHYKQQWKVFLRTGIFVLVALVAIIIACIAWFVSNNRVTGSTGTIQAVGSEFDLAATGTSENKGVHDGLLNAQPGTDIKLSEVDYASTDGEHTSITWAITENSNVNNKTKTGINPGSSGSLTFYIISHKDGPLSVKINLTFTGYHVEGWNSTAATNTAERVVKKSDLKELDEPTQQLLEGHVLFFAGYDENSNSYKAWISDDAEPWNMTLENTCIKTSNAGNDTESSEAALNEAPLLTRNED